MRFRDAYRDSGDLRAIHLTHRGRDLQMATGKWIIEDLCDKIVSLTCGELPAPVVEGAYTFCRAFALSCIRGWSGNDRHGRHSERAGPGQARHARTEDGGDAL